MRRNVFKFMMMVTMLLLFQKETFAADIDQEIIQEETFTENSYEDEADILGQESLLKDGIVEDSNIEDLSDQPDIVIEEDGSTSYFDSENAASYDDEEDWEDEEETEEETEETEREPQEILRVVVSGTNFYLQPGALPKYNAKVTDGNAKVLYEGWSDDCDNADYSSPIGYQDNEKVLTKLIEGENYWYHVSIGTKDHDYFTENTRFLINGRELTGQFISKYQCRFDYIYNIVAECSHTYKKIKTDATCTQDGREYKKCSRCGEEITLQAFPATGHNYELDEDKSIAVTCVNSGVEVYVCQNEDCESTYQKTLPALGHHMVFDIEEPATGKEEGTCTKICDRDDCGYAEKTRTIFPYKKIVLPKLRYSYTGSKIIPSFKVVDILGKTISPQYYYTVCYNNKTIGTATIHLTFSGLYKGKLTKTFDIVKGSQKISVKASTFTVSKADVKKKAFKIDLGAKAKTKLSYKSSSKKVTVKNGIVTIKKGTKMGTYTITVTAKGTKNWKKATRKIKIKIK